MATTPGLTDYINNFTSAFGLAPMKAYNDTIGWDPTKNALDQSYSSPLKGQYDNFVNTQLKPDFQMNTYAPTVRSYGISNNANGGYMLGDNTDASNKMQTGLQRQYTDQQQSAYDSYNNLANQNYTNGLQSYYINNPNAFTNRDPNAQTPTQSVTASQPQQTQSVQQTPTTPQYNQYQVKRGDTLSGIWNSQYRNKIGYNDFINKVKQNNGISNPNLIVTGSTLKLPTL